MRTTAQARQREEHSSLRHVLWLPFLRTADMWLRPRTELLDVETRWWEFSEHEAESWFALFWAGLNLFYILAALRGWLVSRPGIAGVFVICFVLLRSFFLSSPENPEPCYMLECFPVVLALAGAAFARSARRRVLPSLPVKSRNQELSGFSKTE